MPAKVVGGDGGEVYSSNWMKFCFYAMCEGVPRVEFKQTYDSYLIYVFKRFFLVIFGGMDYRSPDRSRGQVRKLFYSISLDQVFTL